MPLLCWQVRPFWGDGDKGHKSRPQAADPLEGVTDTYGAGALWEVRAWTEAQGSLMHLGVQQDQGFPGLLYQVGTPEPWHDPGERPLKDRN